jgi:hypothetical protein
VNLFFVRPTTRNIGNDIIAYASARLVREVFGAGVNIVNIPALRGPQFGGLVARQVHDMNRLADAVILGAGNLLENGQVSYEAQAVDALRPPMLMMALSHGRVAGRDGELEARTDSLHPNIIRHLAERSVRTVVRDEASRSILGELGVDAIVGGCPTLFLPPSPESQVSSGDILISVRHPLRMTVPPPLQWRIAEDLRRLIATLRSEFRRPVRLACHDYIDLEFAAGFPDASPAYFDEAAPYMEALRGCALHVSYRLHGFLPCLAFGTHSIHLSYDERGRSMLRTIGLQQWDVDLLTDRDCVSAVLDRARSRDRYVTARRAVMPSIAALRQISILGLTELKGRTVPVADGRRVS